MARRRKKKAIIEENGKFTQHAQAEEIAQGIRDAAREETTAAARRKEHAEIEIDGRMLEEEVAAQKLEVETEKRRERLLRDLKGQKNPPTKDSIELYLDGLIIRR